MSLNDKDLARLARETGLTDADLGDFMTDYGYCKNAIMAFADAVAKRTAEECLLLMDPALALRAIHGRASPDDAPRKAIEAKFCGVDAWLLKKPE